MADTTARWGFPYQEATDPPDGASLGQDLAEKIELELGEEIDFTNGRVTTLEDERVRWRAGVGATSSSSAIGTTETVVLTVPSFTYKANRAYKIVVSGAVTASVANNTPLLRLRKTNTSGQQFDVWRVPCINTATHGAGYQCYFIVGGSDVTGTIVLTLTGAAGFNATLSAAATSPASVNVFEVGAASNFSWAATLV